MITITTADYTPYKISTLVNQVLADNNIDRTVPPQMMYNYDRNGLIVKGQKGQKRYTANQVADFLNRYFLKNYKLAQVAQTTTSMIVDPFATFSGTDKVSLVRQ